MNKGVLIWGYIASFVLLLGAIFLNHNFIAGKVLYLTGFLAFSIGYLIPLFWVIFKENQENKIGLVLVFGILGFISFLTGVSFFVVNWGGGIILIYVGAGILILALLTLIAFSRRFYETHIDSWFPVLVFGVFIVGSLLIGMVHRHVMRAFSIQNLESVRLYQALAVGNKASYSYLKQTWSRNADFTGSVPQIVNLEQYTKQAIAYIERLKHELIVAVEGDAYKMLDGKTLANLVPVQSNVEINTVSHFMLKKGGGRAYDLKKQLDVYKGQIGKMLLPGDSATLYFVNSVLNTEAFNLGNRRFNKTWEYQCFYDLPLIAVLSRLSKIQANIGIVERETLNNYFRFLLFQAETEEELKAYTTGSQLNN